MFPLLLKFVKGQTKSSTYNLENLAEALSYHKIKSCRKCNNFSANKLNPRKSYLRSFLSLQKRFARIYL